MPTVLELPRLSHAAVAKLPPAPSSALLTFTHIVNAPPDLPNLDQAVQNGRSYLISALALRPSLAAPLAAFIADLDAANLALHDSSVLLHQPQGLAGRAKEYRAWSVCTSCTIAAPDIVRQLIGLELARGYLLQRQFCNALADKVAGYLRKLFDAKVTDEDEEVLEKALRKKLHDFTHILEDRTRGRDAATADFNARVVASLLASMSSLRVEERQAAGRINELSPNRLKQVAGDLKRRIGHDDCEALQIALCFCVGLPYHLSLDVPIITGEASSSVIWINARTGCIHIDLERAFPSLSKRQTDQHIQTTLILVRPLPLLLGELLHRSLASSPSVKTISELAPSGGRHSRNSALSAYEQSADTASIARFIASAAGTALRAGVPRDLAAYSTLSLSLISKSDHHYIVQERGAIWGACGTVYKTLGWGNAVPDSSPNDLAVGSRLTPKVAWVIESIAEKRQAADDARPGKRYTLNSLIGHHNRYTEYVGLMMLVLVGGRARRNIEYQAQDWESGCGFGQLADKLVGATLGLTPLPIPSRLARQLDYWRAHLFVLERRLKRLEFPDDHATRVHIDSLIHANVGNLLFVLDEHGGIAPLETQVILSGKAHGLSSDFGRHIVPGLLTKSGLPFEYAQAWLRHFQEGLSPAEATGTHIQCGWLSKVATKLDAIALDLGLDPMHGLARKSK